MGNQQQKRGYSVREAAQYLSLSKSFLDHARLSGDGPKFIRVGRRNVLYLREDLDAWLDQHQRYRHTAEESVAA